MSPSSLAGQTRLSFIQTVSLKDGTVPSLSVERSIKFESNCCLSLESPIFPRVGAWLLEKEQNHEHSNAGGWVHTTVSTHTYKITMTLPSWKSLCIFQHFYISNKIPEEHDYRNHYPFCLRFTGFIPWPGGPIISGSSVGTVLWWREWGRAQLFTSGCMRVRGGAAFLPWPLKTISRSYLLQWVSSSRAAPTCIKP